VENFYPNAFHSFANLLSSAVVIILSVSVNFTIFIDVIFSYNCTLANMATAMSFQGLSRFGWTQ
jgi:hypothetical protein